MIYCLTGTLLEKSLDNVVIDVQGVGFSLAVPSTVQGVLPAVGEKCTLYTYLSVKEDALDLYGFADKAEQKAFKTLISVSGGCAYLTSFVFANGRCEIVFNSKCCCRILLIA